MAHGAGHRGRRGDAHLLRVDQKLLAEPLDLGPERGGEHESLADARERLDDALDIGDEAHVEHAVGLVDHQHLDAAQHDLAPLEHVYQAAGGGDQNVGVLAERGFLKREPLAADEQRLAQAVVGAVGDEVVRDLLSELSRRRQDQAARHARLARAGAQYVDDRQRVGCGLARAGLGAAQQVDAAQDQRDGLLLNRRRRLVAGPGNGGEQRLAHAEIRKSLIKFHGNSSIAASMPHPAGLRATRRARAPAWHPAACRGPMTRCRIFSPSPAGWPQGGRRMTRRWARSGRACDAASSARAPPTLAEGQRQSPSTRGAG